MTWLVDWGLSLLAAIGLVSLVVAAVYTVLPIALFVYRSL